MLVNTHPQLSIQLSLRRDLLKTPAGGVEGNQGRKLKYRGGQIPYFGADHILTKSEAMLFFPAFKEGLVSGNALRAPTPTRQRTWHVWSHLICHIHSCTSNEEMPSTGRFAGPAKTTGPRRFSEKRINMEQASGSGICLNTSFCAFSYSMVHPIPKSSCCNNLEATAHCMHADEPATPVAGWLSQTTSLDSHASIATCLRS